jgi:hypothetical protein
MRRITRGRSVECDAATDAAAAPTHAGATKKVARRPRSSSGIGPTRDGPCSQSLRPAASFQWCCLRDALARWRGAWARTGWASRRWLEECLRGSADGGPAAPTSALLLAGALRDRRPRVPVVDELPHPRFTRPYQVRHRAMISTTNKARALGTARCSTPRRRTRGRHRRPHPQARPRPRGSERANNTSRGAEFRRERLGFSNPQRLGRRRASSHLGGDRTRGSSRERLKGSATCSNFVVVKKAPVGNRARRLDNGRTCRPSTSIPVSSPGRKVPRSLPLGVSVPVRSCSLSRWRWASGCVGGFGAVPPRTSSRWSFRGLDGGRGGF